jgi:AraC-like DNA-binding protein
MKLNASPGFGPGSVSAENTPSLASQRLPFYTTAVGHFFTDERYFTEREGLENSFLLFYTLGGRGRLTYRGGEWALLPGQACIINCFEYQYYSADSNEPWDFQWVHIGGAMVGEYEDRINQGSLSLVTLGEPCRTGTALDGIMRLLGDKTDVMADLKICEALMAVLTELVIARQRPSEAAYPHEQEVQAAMRYIHENYSQISGIDEIIGCAYISKYYFLRQFKSYTGLGLYEYLNNHRIDIAKQLLKYKGCKVSGAALSVGFNDVNCFIRYFKKVTGVTPAIYQKYYLY